MEWKNKRKHGTKIETRTTTKQNKTNSWKIHCTLLVLNTSHHKNK